MKANKFFNWFYSAIFNPFQPPTLLSRSFWGCETNRHSEGPETDKINFL